MKKEELARLGLGYIEKFCETNNIKVPKVNFINKLSGCCGYYDKKQIYVSLKDCAAEAKTPGFSWSHRHYFVDREPCGVICHEFGHYLHDILTNYKCILPKERKLTSYEPDMGERFAETVKLFILNPDLLRQYDPKRYKVLTEKLGLKPIFTETWQELMELAGMNQKYIKTAEKRINKRKK